VSKTRRKLLTKPLEITSRRLGDCKLYCHNSHSFTFIY